MKILSKIIIIMCIILIEFGQVHYVYGASLDLFSKPDEFIRKGKQYTPENGTTEKTMETYQKEIRDASSNIYNVLFAIGVALTVIVGGILGIRFIMASAEEKAQIKEMLIPYIAGCIVIYGAFGIWKLVVSILNSVS